MRPATRSPLWITSKLTLYGSYFNGLTSVSPRYARHLRPARSGRGAIVALCAALGALSAGAGAASAQEMSFFVTSTNPGSGGDLGGIAGADAHCEALATAAGVTGRTWRAYLSTAAEDARDRIGSGPWVNADGVEIAADVAALHSEANNLTKETAVTETGEVITGRGDDPNRHDILTGSHADGTRAAETCEDWTSSAAEGATAMVGHHDRLGPDTLATATSWNAAHPSRGCSLEALQGTGGDGLFYCFALD